MKLLNRKIRVIDCRAEPVEVPFEVFIQLKVRDVLSVDSEYLLEMGTPPILVASGDKTYGFAKRLNPERTVFLHEVIVAVVPFWTSDLMDKPLIELPSSAMGNEEVSKILAQIQSQAEGAEALA